MVATAIFGREKSGSDHAGWESFRYLCKYDSVFLVSNKTQYMVEIDAELDSKTLCEIPSCQRKKLNTRSILFYRITHSYRTPFQFRETTKLISLTVKRKRSEKSLAGNPDWAGDQMQRQRGPYWDLHVYIYNYMYTVYSMYMYVYFYTGHYILYIYNIYIRSHTRRSKESPALEKWCIRCIRDNWIQISF